MVSFTLKITIIVCLAILIRGTLPRYRVDQLISLNWKFFIFYLFIFFLILIFNIITLVS